MSLPYVNVTWDEVDPGEDIFAWYNVYRNNIRIATVESVATPWYDDYVAPPNADLTYEVSWTAQIGLSFVEGDRASVDHTVDFSAQDAYLHVVGSESTFIVVPATAVAISSNQITQFVRARGRREPTLRVGEGYWREATITLAPEYHGGEPSLWDLFRLMHDAQYSSGAVLCLRMGHSSERMFCAINSSLTRTDDPKFQTVTASLTEVYYNEVV